MYLKLHAMIIHLAQDPMNEYIAIKMKILYEKQKGTKHNDKYIECKFSGTV